MDVGKVLGAQQQKSSLYDLPSSPRRKNHIEGAPPISAKPADTPTRAARAVKREEEKTGDERSRRLFGQLGNMRLQFSLLRGNLVISNGVEAWTLMDGKWERTDALAAFLRSTWLKSDEAIRMFGEALPDLPPEAFVGLKVGRHGLSRTGPRIGRAPLRRVTSEQPTRAAPARRRARRTGSR